MPISTSSGFLAVTDLNDFNGRDPRTNRGSSRRLTVQLGRSSLCSCLEQQFEMVACPRNHFCYNFLTVPV
jgi:hypothetical protein